ncbi:MAG: IS66 family transposase [Spirochaetota bacterium]
MGAAAHIELDREDRREIAAWFDANREALPESVQRFLSLHEKYLNAEGNLRKKLNEALQELRRALHLTPSSERRKPSGSPLAGLPRAASASVKSERERLESQVDRSNRLADWHEDLKGRHEQRAERIEKRLAKIPKEQAGQDSMTSADNEIPRLEDIETTEEDAAKAKAAGARFAANLSVGEGQDPALASVNETLMPSGSVIEHEAYVHLPAVVPEALANAKVVRQLDEPRVRYDLSVQVTRIELDVEKKVLEDDRGDRHVVSASTNEYGPPRFSVTWSALATLTTLVGHFAMPFNRLATMFSTPDKTFTTGGISRMLHYVARRLVPIYLALSRQLADAEVLAGDDTSCRVIEASSYFAKSRGEDAAKPATPPWASYRNPSAAEQSIRRSQDAKEERLKRREDGDRTAGRTPAETPSLGALIGRRLTFESPRRNGDGSKEAMHTTVVSGRSVADDPSSLIVFYRSHIGGCGNLLESILANRNPKLKKVVLQGDMSSTNLINNPRLLERFDIGRIGCAAHARRPFANYEHEDPVRCEYMLHLFLGLSMHERQLNAVGRNRENVLAVRGQDSRELWDDILRLARKMAEQWSPATKLGTAARYIIKHFEPLTAYLDDPHLEPANNLRERMLRMEKLIQSNSMFRRSLEGRFVLDIVRTVLQTAVAAGVPVHEYLVSVLRTNPDDIAQHPERFTPHAWTQTNAHSAEALQDHAPSGA